MFFQAFSSGWDEKDKCGSDVKELFVPVTDSHLSFTEVKQSALRLILRWMTIWDHFFQFGYDWQKY